MISFISVYSDGHYTLLLHTFRCLPYHLITFNMNTPYLHRKTFKFFDHGYSGPWILWTIIFCIVHLVQLMCLQWETFALNSRFRQTSKWSEMFQLLRETGFITRFDLSWTEEACTLRTFSVEAAVSDSIMEAWIWPKVVPLLGEILENIKPLNCWKQIEFNPKYSHMGDINTNQNGATKQPEMSSSNHSPKSFWWEMNWNCGGETLSPLEMLPKAER